MTTKYIPRSSGGIGRRVGLKIQSGFTLGASSSLAWSNYLRLTPKGKSFLVHIQESAKNLFTRFILVMGLHQALEKSLTKFGENNTPAVVSMGIAAAKGVFRPIFTMSDKKQDYETKRYTALREGLTELIAIPVYYLSGIASKVVAEKLAKPKYFIKKDVFEKAKAGDTSEEILNAIKHAEVIAKENLPKIQTTAGFIGVCLSALLVIPLVCSITIKPIMKRLEKNKTSVNNQDNIQPLAKRPTFKQKMPIKHPAYQSNIFTSMKVGGV